MVRSRLARARSIAKKAFAAGPEILMRPSQAFHAFRGAHWATLNMLDKIWIRNFGIDMVIDVGANTGQFASACHVVFPNANIYSFEPLPECFESLEKKMKDVPHFRAFNLAMGEHVGR